jgi:hypothetical protein
VPKISKAKSDGNVARHLPRKYEALFTTNSTINKKKKKRKEKMSEHEQDEC